MRYCNVKTNDSNNGKWLDDRLEAYLDGELSAEEQSQFEEIIEHDDAWQQEMAWAVTIRDELRAIPTPAPSKELEKAILKEVRKDAWTGFRSRLFSGFGSGLFQDAGFVWRPVFATLMLLVMATVVVFVLNRPNLPNATPESFSQAEVEQATEEAKWALGYVTKTGRMTGTSMQDALAPLLKEQTRD